MVECFDSYARIQRQKGGLAAVSVGLCDGFERSTCTRVEVRYGGLSLRSIHVVTTGRVAPLR